MTKNDRKYSSVNRAGLVSVLTILMAKLVLKNNSRLIARLV